MLDLYKQVFLRDFSDNPKREEDFSLFESVGEFFGKNVANAKEFYSRFQTLRNRISFYKTKVMSDLPNYLIDFELKLNRSGGKVIYAENAEQACQEIDKLIAGENNLFLSKGDILQEIGLKFFLKTNGKKFVQSDMHRLPYPIQPECADKIYTDLIEAYTLDDLKPDRENVMNFYKTHLTEKLYSSSVAITGADFLVSDIGGVVLTDNSGLDTLYASFCRKHIVVAGIDSLIPSLSDMDYFTTMLASHGLGRVHAWNEMVITGPKGAEELDGAEEMYVILLDNGRTRMLSQAFQRSVSNCINCKACLALCPVFKFTNRLDNPPLKGPLNCIIDPVCKGFEDNGYLSFACTLCGKCSEVCPVKINLQELILYNRKEAVEKDYCYSIEKKPMRTLKKMFLRTKALESGRYRLLMKMKFKKQFGSQKEFPDFGKKSFRMIWREQQEQQQNQ